MDIDTSLLREKFVIKEHDQSHSKALKIYAPSTRMPLTLQSGGLDKEHYIVRTKSTHSCARIVASLVEDYNRYGPFGGRTITPNWKEMWDDTASNYDKFYNRERWFALYKNGKKLFSAGQYHSFFDVIEKCDAVTKNNYEKSLALAEEAFKTAGKSIHIQHESNVALVAVLNKKEHRCSMILRGADRTTTFNYTIKVQDRVTQLSTSQGLSSSADFLEGVELCYLVGTNNANLDLGVVEPFSDPDNRARKARVRINETIAHINSMENRFRVRYRPERPDFDLIMEHAESYAREQEIARRAQANPE